MPNTTYHAPIMHILAAAGLRMSCEVYRSRLPSVRKTPILAAVDEEEWMEERHLSLQRIRERKTARRMGRIRSTCVGMGSQASLPQLGIEKEEEQNPGEEAGTRCKEETLAPETWLPLPLDHLLRWMSDTASVESWTLIASDTG